MVETWQDTGTNSSRLETSEERSRALNNLKMLRCQNITGACKKYLATQDLESGYADVGGSPLTLPNPDLHASP